MGLMIGVDEDVLGSVSPRAFKYLFAPEVPGSTPLLVPAIKQRVEEHRLLFAYYAYPLSDPDRPDSHLSGVSLDLHVDDPIEKPRQPVGLIRNYEREINQYLDQLREVDPGVRGWFLNARWVHVIRRNCFIIAAMLGRLSGAAMELDAANRLEGCRRLIFPCVRPLGSDQRCVVVGDYPRELECLAEEVAGLAEAEQRARDGGWKPEPIEHVAEHTTAVWAALGSRSAKTAAQREEEDAGYVAVSEASTAFGVERTLIYTWIRRGHVRADDSGPVRRVSAKDIVTRLVQDAPQKELQQAREENETLATLAMEDAGRRRRSR